MQVKSMYRGVKTTKKNQISRTMRQMRIENPYANESGIGGKSLPDNPNKPAMPERQDKIKQVKALETSIAKDQRRLANGLALRSPDKASNVVKMIAGKRERVLTLLDEINASLALPAVPESPKPHRPAKVRPEKKNKTYARWSEL